MLLTKLQANNSYSTLQMIQVDAIKSLLQFENELIVGALSEMLKIIVASFPMYEKLPHLFLIVIEFIEYHYKVEI